MWISKIKLNNFRNYEKQEIVLKDGINLFYGENAQGKTNIIESIYLCSVGKSFRARRDQELIKFDTNKSLIEVEFNKSDRDGKIKIEIENKKNISVNGIKLKKLSELLGNINIGDNVKIGANSVVTKNVESNSIIIEFNKRIK